MKIPRRLWVWIFAGLMIRLIFFPMIGFQQDFLFLVSWAEYLANHSPITIYRDASQLSIQFVNYPPFYLYLLTGLARIYRAFTDAPFDRTVFLCMIKGVTLLFELAGGWALYAHGKRRGDERTGVWAFALYFLNPAIIYVSAYYGQLDAIFAAFLLWAMIAWDANRPSRCGAMLALALSMKLQTLPFLPLFFLLPLLWKRYHEAVWMGVGFILTGALLLAPYAWTGQIGHLLQQCVLASFAWGKFLTVGAFNLWYLHANPVTYDGRIWGIFFDRDGILYTHVFFDLLTYKNLGTALFGFSFLLTLYGVWKRRESPSFWVSAMHVALAFFMLPTKVHERYLFPYFIFAAPLAVQDKGHRILFYGFSLTYLLNLMVICPLIGHSVDVRQIDSVLGVYTALLNVLLYAVFVVYEYGGLFTAQPRWLLVYKTVTLTLLIGFLVLFLRAQARQANPLMIYLSDLAPTRVEQDWPLIPPEKLHQPLAGYEQLKADLSCDGNPLRIGNTVFQRGLGAHAISRVDYEVPGDYPVFECYAGVDWEAVNKYDEAPDVATVTFAVWVNDLLLYTSPLTIPYTPPRYISVRLPDKPEGTNHIRLVVDGTADGIDSDHADWCMARVVRLTNPLP